MSNNYVDATGLHTQDLNALVTQLVDGLKLIYGSDINVQSNTPDGQMVNLYAQAQADILDCIASVFNSFSPTNAVGSVLDSRCAINGVIRQGATYTRTNVTVTTDRVLVLQGIDLNPNNPFTVSDTTGTLFYLEATTTTGTGANVLTFRAANAGNIQTLPNTLNVIVTITLGVLTVNNPTSPITIGVNEETDSELRIRRELSVALPSEGYLPGLLAAIDNVTNVIDAKVYENNTGTTDSNGIPGHSIWAVVDGGANSDIATAIYRHRSAGCGMRGSVVVNVPQVNGYNMAVKFDRPTYINLYIQLVLESIDLTHTPDITAIKNMLFDKIFYKIYQPSDYTAITTLVKEFDPLLVVISGGVSLTAGSYVPFLYPVTKAGRFLIDQTRMDITSI